MGIEMRADIHTYMHTHLQVLLSFLLRFPVPKRLLEREDSARRDPFSPPSPKPKRSEHFRRREGFGPSENVPTSDTAMLMLLTSSFYEWETQWLSCPRPDPGWSYRLGPCKGGKA